MKKKYIFIFLFCTMNINTFSQSEQIKYREIDSLINSGTYFNNFKAMMLLDNEFVTDTLNSHHWIKRSLAYYYMNKYKKAISSINKGIGFDKNNANLYYEKAKLIMDIEQDNTKAIKLLDKAIMLDDKNGEFYFYRGIYSQLDGKVSKAISNYEYALSLDYKNQGLYRNYTNLLVNNNLSLKKALELINKAIELSPDIGANYQTKGNVLLMLIEPDKACNNYSKAIKNGYKLPNEINDALCKTNKSKDKYILLGDILFSMKKHPNAIKSYNIGIKNEKDSTRFYLNRGYSYYKIKKYDKAEQDYLQALKLSNPEIDKLYDNLSLLYYEQEEFEQAIEYSTKRIELDPNNHVPYIDRGLCYRKIKKYTKAEMDFNKSLEIKPDFYRAFGYRSYLFLELDDVQKAFNDAKKSIELNPRYGYGYLMIANCKIALSIPDFCVDLYKAKEYGMVEEAEIGIEKHCKIN